MTPTGGVHSNCTHPGAAGIRLSCPFPRLNSGSSPGHLIQLAALGNLCVFFFHCFNGHDRAQFEKRLHRQ